MTIRPDLVASFGEERLPRYTSYPTAPHFSKAVTADTYGSWLAAIEPDSKASLYVHIPFCRAMCWYCGCHTSVAKRDDIVEAYAHALCREVELVSRQLSHRLHVSHIHFGGGTPTILQPRTLSRLVGLLRSCFDVRPDAEFAIEIDPRVLTAEMVDVLRDCGINRASIGVQSFDPTVQQAINRPQSFAQAAAATDALRAAGVRGINFDLIYGLPHQTLASCIDTVVRCVELRPERLSVFGYAHVPSFKSHQRRIAESALPDAAERYRQFETIAATLGDFGYRRVGLDHFCLPSDAMSAAHTSGTLRRNFQGYTTDSADVLLGFGASAIGRLDQGYVQNEVGVRAYEKRLASGSLATIRGHAFTDEDRMRGEIIERIMCDFGADIREICERYRRTPDSVLAGSSRLDGLIATGVASMRDAKLRVADDARVLVRTVAATFDGYLANSAASHSRAV